MFNDVKKCPFCQYQNSVEEFLKWKQDDQRGLRGKQAESFILLLCPQCNKEIKWDTLADVFVRPDQKAKKRTVFYLIIFIVTAIFIFGIIRFMF
jgi:hypothetical protein